MKDHLSVDCGHFWTVYKRAISTSHVSNNATHPVPHSNQHFTVKHFQKCVDICEHTIQVLETGGTIKPLK